MLNRFSGIENIMRIGDKMVRTAGSITGVDTGKTLRFSHDTFLVLQFSLAKGEESRKITPNKTRIILVKRRQAKS